MPTDYGSADVLCPFYRSERGRSIGCEGMTERSWIVQYYASVKDKLEQKRIFCNTGNYRKCEIYRAVMEAKYAEEEDLFGG